MPDSKHTPGPWELIGHPDDDECRVRQSSSVRHGHGFYSETTICEQINKMANARLIAAAPDLLEALQDLVTELGDDWNLLHNYIDRARAAIDKATQPLNPA